MGETPRRHSNNPVLWGAIGVLAAILCVCVIVVVKSIRLAGQETMADAEPGKKQDVRSVETTETNAVDKPLVNPPVARTDLKAIQLEQLWQRTKPALFRITAIQGDKQTQGLAFSINDRGWLATSYQLVKDADAVKLLAVGGESTEEIPSTGLIASDPRHNLAVIEIALPPKSHLQLTVATLTIDDKLAVCQRDEASQLHLVSTTYAKTTGFSDLPANSRAVARQLGLDEADNLFWLEHSQPIEAGDEGAPLLNTEGDVVGINSHLSPTSETGFALPSAYLLELLETASEKPMPFRAQSTEIAETGLNFDPAAMAPGEVPKPPSRTKPGTLESIDAIRELQEICVDIRWQPETIGEYQVMQDLAEYIYVAKKNEDDPNIEEGLRVLIAAAAQEVLVELSETAWPSEEKIASLNAFAVEGLKSEGKGIFCYVTVANTRSEANAVDGTPTILCNLIDSAQAIVVPVQLESRMLKKQSRWLLIGKQDPAHTFDLLADDGSKRVAPTIRAQNLLGEPKEQRDDVPAPRRGRR